MRIWVKIQPFTFTVKLIVRAWLIFSAKWDIG